MNLKRIYRKAEISQPVNTSISLLLCMIELHLPIQFHISWIRRTKVGGLP
jgi:hypothetical protein